MSAPTSPALAPPPRWRREPSIRVRIVLLILAVLVPAAGLVAWLLVLELRQARVNAHDKITILTDDTVGNLRHVLQTSQILLARVASRPGVRALDPAACDATLAEAFAASRGVTGLELHDSHGMPVCACDAAGNARRAEPAAAWQVRAVAAPGLSAGPPHGSASGRQAIELAYPVRDATGAPHGVISASFDLLELGERLLSDAPAGAVVSVIDADGALLLRSSRAGSFVGQRVPVDVPAIDPGTDIGVVERTGGDGTRRLFAVRTLPEVGWRVLSGLPTAEVFADYRASAMRAAVVVTAVLLTALSLAGALGASITRPIAQLRRTARRVAGGAGNERVDESGPPELRAVMHDFNRMLDSLALSQARLQGVLDSTSEAIITADASQRIVFANRAAVQTFATPVERLVGAEMASLLPARYRQRHLTAIERFGRTDDPIHSLGGAGLRAQRSDGTEFPIEGSISRFCVNGQRLYTAVVRDLTEQQQAQATFATALASMTDAVCVCDAGGRFVEFNEAFVAFHRFPSRADCPTDIAALAQVVDLAYAAGPTAAPDDWPQARAQQGESAVGIEYALRRKGGASWIGSYAFAPLRDANGTIFGSVVSARDVTAVRATKRELEESHAALRRLVGARDRAQEDERKRIARELHDDLQQTLGAIKMESVIAVQTRAGEVPAAAVALRRIEHLATVALQSSRRIINGLRPQMLEELGLAAALGAMTNQMLERNGVVCELRIDHCLLEEGNIDASVATCLYRVAQEALNNVIKHADATRVSMSLSAGDGRWISLQIRDNGRGVDAADRAKPGAFGLLGMRERLLAVGGLLNIVRNLDAGTFIEARVPHGGVDAPDTRSA